MPVPARHISRPTLFQRLDVAAKGPVTVVSAPAGSGKSSLVRSWLAARGSSYRAAWVSVERGERDEHSFWSTVIDELSAAIPPGFALQSLTKAADLSGDAVVGRLVADLASLEDPIVLVIDDVQEVADPAIRRNLASLLEHLPSALHVVLISRRDLQLGLHRRRLQGELAEMRNDELQFSIGETRQLVESRGISLSDQGLRLLHERTEGWVTGLLLATVLLAAHPEPERLIVEFSGSERTVAEYLLAEVLHNQPADVRRLLLRASVLDRVNGALGDLLTGGFGSERQLQELAGAGAFVVSLNPQGTWFRFHRLFADLLAVELRLSEPEELPHLHLRAAKWFAEHEFPLEAIKHAQAAGDHQLAAAWLIQHYFTLMLDGRQDSAHLLLEAYSLEFLQNPPEIAAVVAIDELARGSLEQAAAHLALAERDADRVPASERPTFDVALFLTRVTLARRRGDLQSVLAEVNSRDVFIEPRGRRDILVNNDVRTLVQMNLGMVEVWSGSLDSGVRHLMEGRDLARQIGRPYLEVACLAQVGQAESWTSFTGAGAACSDAIALAEAHGWGTDPVIAPAYVTLGAAFLQAGRLDDGERWLIRAERILRAELEPTVGCLLQTSYGALRATRGQFAKALENFREAERLGLFLIGDSPLLTQQRAGALYAQLDSGDRESVRRALATMTDNDRQAEDFREVTAALALADANPEGALAALAPIITGPSHTHRRPVLVRSLLLQVSAHHALGQAALAETALERALDVAEPDTVILPFMLLCSREALERHPRGRTSHGAFIREILDAFGGIPAGLENPPDAPVLDSLSAAEVRLLRYLSTNLTAASIGTELNVATNTVKTHMRHIYAKLGAHTREEAVSRARSLGLLGPSSRR